jgi:hypothetical protein
MEYICPFRDEAKDVTVLFLVGNFGHHPLSFHADVMFYR